MCEEEKVYDEVKDISQPCTSLKWIMKEKIINDKKTVKFCLYPNVKTAFLRRKTIDRTVFVRPPQEVKTNQIWKLQIWKWRKHIYGILNASQYWYLKLIDKLIKLGALHPQLGQGLFIWTIGNRRRGRMVCFLDDVLWGRNTEFINIINKLKQVFQLEQSLDAHLLILVYTSKKMMFFQ